ncbi:zinc-binding dehydrogenase [Clostridium bovifaecis]|uniref:Zinc-binding dehydrogenase n=1 Tax=Clostridium bovifaecis TaxID=2184719 RepID=A0A6I6F2J2_9CLOT|nr:zinc-binding dehydrogenase [Clostridium bovifaecis]
MKAAVIDRFGGPNELVMKDVPVPSIEDDEVLIKVEYAGVGQWDIFEREGGYDEMLGLHSEFPYILGSEGSGTIYAKGKNVGNFAIGDKVYASGFLNPKGGFYAEFVSIDSKYVSLIPDSITAKEASVISGVGLTALRGLEDVLKLKKNESIMVFGAGGGIGHLAVQLAQNLGARVFAVASGEDGVAMLRKLGVKAVVDGRKDDVLLATMKFAPEGFDTALFTAGGELANSLIQCVRIDGRIAYPNGIYPIPDTRPDISLTGYNGEPEPEILQRLNNWISSGKLKAHIDKVYLLEDAYKAHLALNNHYVGKLCFKVND